MSLYICGLQRIGSTYQLKVDHPTTDLLDLLGFFRTQA
jgi:hypothetical protein